MCWRHEHIVARLEYSTSIFSKYFKHKEKMDKASYENWVRVVLAFEESEVHKISIIDEHVL